MNKKETKNEIKTMTEAERRAVDDKHNSWTVLLLRPDYATDDFGKDTFTAQVRAPTPAAAIAKARKEAIVCDGGTHPEDYHCLGCYRGYLENYSDEEGKD